jgi:ATP-binding protein involved in chromosome partitioning
MDPFPTNIQQAGADVLAITWNDGVESHYRVFDLRAACPCAQCVDELTGKRILEPKNVDPEVQIKWSDGHDTGIYSWIRLRALAAN